MYMLLQRSSRLKRERLDPWVPDSFQPPTQTYDANQESHYGAV